MVQYTREQLENLSVDQIQALIDERRAEKEERRAIEDETLGQKLPRLGALATKSAVKGVAGVGDILLSPVGAAAHLAGYKLPNMREGVEKASNYLTHDYTKARTPNERVLEAGTEAISGMGPLGAASKAINLVGKSAKPTTSIIKKVSRGTKDFIADTLGAGSKLTAQNVTMNAGTSAAIQKLIEEGYEPDEAMGIVLGGSFVLPKVGKGIISPKISAKKTVKPILKNIVAEDVLDAFKDSGIQPTVGEVIPSLRRSQQAMHALFSSPGNQVFNKRSAQVRDILGVDQKSLSKREFGEEIQDTLATRKGRKSKEATDLFESIPIKHTSLVDPENIYNFLQQARGKHLSAEDKIRFDSTYAGKTLEKLKADLREFKGKIPYGTLKDELTEMNAAAKGTHGQISSKYEGLLKEAINRGKQDLDLHLEQVGGDALAAQKKANSYYSDYMKEKPILNKMTKIDHTLSEVTDSPKALLTELSKGRTDLLKILKDEQKHSGKGNLNSSVLYELGKVKNSKGEIGDYFSPHRFFERYDALEPEIKEMLIDHLPTNSGKKKIDDLLKTIMASKELANEANFSGTASHDFLYSLLENPKAKIGASAATGAGAIANLPATVATLGVIYGGSSTMSSPKTINLLHNVLKANPKTNLSMALNKMSKSDNPGIAKVGTIARKVYLDNLKETQKHGALKKTISRGLQAQNRSREEKK